MSNDAQPERLIELESLRGIAAMLVVLFHMPQWYPPFHAFPLIRNGGFMVDLFFVLSGFVITRAYGDRIQSGADVLRFQLVRLGRLYPVHLLFLLAFFGIELARMLMQSSGTLSSAQAPFASNSLDAFGLQLLLAQALGPSEYWGTFNGPAWSISIEFYGYLVFALVAWLGGRARDNLFLLLFAAGSAMLVFEIGGNPNIARFLAGFFAGACVVRIIGWSRAALPEASVPLAFAALAAILWFKGDRLATILPVILASAILVGALAASSDGVVRRLLRRAAFEKLGAWSYSIYMSHFLVIYIASQAVNRISTAPLMLVDGNMLPQPGPWIALSWSASVIVITLIISAAAYRWIENPLRFWARRTVAERFGPISKVRQSGDADGVA